jgi:hypothetical protein
VLLALPGGLGQLIFGLRDRFLRRVAERRGILVPSLVADKRESGGAREDEGLLTAALGGGEPASTRPDPHPDPDADDRQPDPVGAAR